MNDEIKEILDDLLFTTTLPNVSIKLNKEKLNQLKDYITNLQQQLHQASLDIQELTERDIGCPSWCDKLTNLQQENERLKAIWKDTNVIVKDNKTLVMNTNAYDTLEDYKSRCEKAIEYIKEHYPTSTINYQDDKYKLLNILQNGSDSQ